MKELLKIKLTNAINELKRDDNRVVAHVMMEARAEIIRLEKKNLELAASEEQFRAIVYRLGDCNV